MLPSVALAVARRSRHHALWAATGNPHHFFASGIETVRIGVCLVAAARARASELAALLAATGDPANRRASRVLERVSAGGDGDDDVEAFLARFAAAAWGERFARRRRVAAVLDAAEADVRSCVFAGAV